MAVVEADDDFVAGDLAAAALDEVSLRAALDADAFGAAAFTTEAFDADAFATGAMDFAETEAAAALEPAVFFSVLTLAFTLFVPFLAPADAPEARDEFFGDPILGTPVCPAVETGLRQGRILRAPFIGRAKARPQPLFESHGHERGLILPEGRMSPIERSATVTAQKNSSGQTGATAWTMLGKMATFATVKNTYITKCGQNQRNRLPKRQFGGASVNGQPAI